MKNRFKGFTLIELLVVVLIIGILAAIALPQYEKSVLRSRFSRVAVLAKSAAEAHERYYLEHGAYTWDFSALDLDFPSGTFYPTAPLPVGSGGYSQGLWVGDNGFQCSIHRESGRILCLDSRADLGYAIALAHSSYGSVHYCAYRTYQYGKAFEFCSKLGYGGYATGAYSKQPGAEPASAVYAFIPIKI